MRQISFVYLAAKLIKLSGNSKNNYGNVYPNGRLLHFLICQSCLIRVTELSYMQLIPNKLARVGVQSSLSWGQRVRMPRDWATSQLRGLSSMKRVSAAEDC